MELVVKEINQTIDEKQVFHMLLEELKTTLKVKDAELLAEDIKKNSKTCSTKIDDNLFMYHSFSEGVSDFCAAIIVMPDNKIHGMFSCNSYTKENLLNISKLYERIQKYRLQDKNF